MKKGTKRKTGLVRRFFSISIVLVLVLSLGCTVLAIDKVDYSTIDNGMAVPTWKRDTYVYDIENSIDDTVETQVNQLLVDLEKSSSIEFVVMTVPSFAGNSIKDYAYQVAKKLGIGKADKNNGLFFLLSETEGHGRLEVGIGLVGELTDGVAGRILDKFYVPNRDNSDTSKAVYETVAGTIAFMQSKYNFELESELPEAEELREQIEGKPLSPLQKVLITIIIVIIIIGIACDLIFNDGMVTFSFLEIAGDIASSSSSSSGGFGGGSFGGFGSDR